MFVVNATVAQLDRVLGYEPNGRGFESLRLHQKKESIKELMLSFFLIEYRMGFERSVKKTVQWTVFSEWRDSGTATCPAS